MRFRFCRDCDCPDWLLAEILTLSKIKPSTLKELSSLVAGSICGNDLNYEHICQLLSDTKFDEPSIRTSTAALRWILSNATAALIDAQILDSELQQLGLPKEQSEALKETFDAQKNVLKESLKEQTLKASGKVNWSYDIKGIQIGAEKEPVLQLNVEGKILDENKGFRVHDNSSDGMEETEKMSIYMSYQQVGTLINELEEVYRCMKEIKPF